MGDHFVDRLLAAIDDKGSPVCVGLDPVYERLPGEYRRGNAPEDEPLRAVEDFCDEVIRIVSPVVPAVKLQSAYFERYGADGVQAYFDMAHAARDAGLIVIGDVKRNDIGPTAGAYAAAHLAGPDAPDAVTVNGYFGADGIAPFVEVARREGKGLFVLVRTSNPSAGTVQDFAGADGRKLYEHVAALVAAIGDGEGLIGRGGYSCVGAVVGATYPEEARRLREIMPHQVFLVPGYGAQGATAADCAAAFKGDGSGAIVNASRSVLYAFADRKYAHLDWRKAVEQAARDFASDIAAAVRGR